MRVDRVVRVDELYFSNPENGAGVSFRDFDALVIDAPEFRLAGLDGILGVPLLADHTFSIDYAGGSLLIGASSLDGGAPHTVPIRFSRGVLFVPINIGGETHWALLDTGSNQGLSVPESELGVLHVDDSVMPRQLVGSVVIAGHEIRNPFVWSKSSQEFVVGSGMLSDMILTIDQRNRLMRLVRSESKRPLDSGLGNTVQH